MPSTRSPSNKLVVACIMDYMWFASMWRFGIFSCKITPPCHFKLFFNICLKISRQKELRFSYEILLLPCKFRCNLFVGTELNLVSE